MAKYINIPFAINGNKNAIPNTTTDGTVNYNDGFGADYAKPIGTDPSAKSVDRETINQALYDYGSAIQQLQENGFYPWQSTKAGGYDIGAAVSFNGANYINEVAGNTNAPDVSGWTQIAKFSDFTSSKAVNGYQKLPSGVIMQWGGPVPVPNSGGSISVTFPIAFPNGFLQCSISVVNAATQMLGFSSPSTTGMTINTGNTDSTSRNACWIAIGY